MQFGMVECRKAFLVNATLTFDLVSRICMESRACLLYYLSSVSQIWSVVAFWDVRVLCTIFCSL